MESTAPIILRPKKHEKNKLPVEQLMRDKGDPTVSKT